MKRKHWELTLIFILLVILFATFLAIPAIRLLVKSFWGETGLTTEFYTSVLTAPQFGTALRNSFAVSAASALLAVGIAFVMAYLIHYTRLPRGFRRAMQAVATLPMPTCLKDLADPVYAGFLAVTDVQSSSTAWLLMQALVSEYGEDGAQTVLHDIYANAGDHIETSGSAPLKLCEAGEIAVGFGLRHQAVAAKAEGLPIDYVDPTEGNFSLTESVAIVDKGESTNPLAMKMAQCIIENGRAELQENYPNPLYEGESADSANKSAYPKTFQEPLTFELYEKHQQISEAAKP